MRVYHQRWTREHRVARDDMPEIARSRVTKAKKHRAGSIHVLAAPPPALPAVWRDFARTPALDHRFQARSSKVQGLVHRGYMHTRVCWITCEGMCRVWDSDTVLTTRARVEFPAQRVGPEQAVLRERRQGLAASSPHQLQLHINPIHPLCRPPARSGRVGIGSLCAASRVRVTARLLVCVRSRAGAQRT